MSLNNDEILKAIAPCSLCCYACPAMKGGIIEETSKTLAHYLIGYHDFLEDNLPRRYSSYAKEIAKFNKQLEKFSKPSCNGCRDNPNEKCCIEKCNILECTKSHGVDFCGFCDEFPCSKLSVDVFGTTTLEEWKKGNERIKEVGIEQFYNEAIAHSHYLPFKKDKSKPKIHLFK